jgi:hypothetical protein
MWRDPRRRLLLAGLIGPGKTAVNWAAPQSAGARRSWAVPATARPGRGRRTGSRSGWTSAPRGRRAA